MGRTEQRMPRGEKSDSKLVDDYRSGRVEAFDELMERHIGGIYNLGARMCHRPEDAEDLVQNTFLNAHRYLGSFRGEALFKNWLFRIAVTGCLRMKRDRTGLRPKEQALEEEEHFPPAGDGDSPEWSRKPDEILLNRELRDKIDRAIHRLTPENRLVFVLRDQEGFSTREAAHIMEISEGAVKTRLHRARTALAAELKVYFDGREHG